MNHKTVATAVGITIAISSVLYVSPANAMKHLTVTSKTTKHLLKGRLSRDVVAADNMMLKGKYSKAADYYRAALNANPNNVAARTGLGMALGKQFKLEAAEEQFNKAIEADPENAMAHAGKAMVNIYRLQSSSASIRKNRDSMLQAAQSEAQKAIEVDPGLPQGHYYLGQALKEQGRLDDAAAQFQQATQMDPDYADAFAQLGLVHLAKNDLGAATASFDQAIAVNSGNSTAHYGLGKVLLQQGQIDDALHELNTALYQYPNSAPTHVAFGEAYLQQGNTVAAVKEFQQAIAIKPENPDAYLHIAAIRETRGDIEHAIAELRSGLELTPDNSDLHMRIADNSLRLEKVDDAMKEYSTVLHSDPQNAVAAKGLTRALYLKSQKEAAGAYFMSNDFDTSKQMLDQAVAMNPNDLELRLAQAKLRAMSGEPVDLSTIGQPKTDGERVAYVEALLAQNRFAEAHEQMGVLLGNSRDAKQSLALGDLALMIKDLDGAQQAYKLAASQPGGASRAKAGMAQVAKAKEVSRQDATLATDLAKRNQLASAIDKYHAAIFENPEVATARMGLARTLEKYNSKSPANLREAAVQYTAFLSLDPSVSAKEQERLTKHIQSLNNRAARIERKIAMQPNTQ